MLLISIISLEAALFIIYIILAKYYIYIFFLLLYTVFWYYSGAEQTGNESKPLFRSWCFWQKWTAVQYMWANKEEFNITKRTYLFVVMPNATNMALISGFGLHGGVFKNNMDIHYILPSILFNVPILREFLLWSGACCAKKDKDVEGEILYLLRRGKSVAYCPTGMNDYFYTEPNTELKLDNSLFQFAFTQKVYIVPVLVEREQDRYHIPGTGTKHSILTRIQQWTYTKLNVPIPLLFIPRIFGQGPPPKMVITIGTSCDPTVHDDAGSYKRLCEGQLHGFIENKV